MPTTLPFHFVYVASQFTVWTWFELLFLWRQHLYIVLKIRTKMHKTYITFKSLFQQNHIRQLNSKQELFLPKTAWKKYHSSIQRQRKYQVLAYSVSKGNHQGNIGEQVTIPSHCGYFLTLWLGCVCLDWHSNVPHYDWQKLFAIFNGFLGWWVNLSLKNLIPNLSTESQPSPLLLTLCSVTVQASGSGMFEVTVAVIYSRLENQTGWAILILTGVARV